MCGRCQSQVMYQVGVSPLIQCTRCFTVNSVPNQPVMYPPPNYQMAPPHGPNNSNGQLVPGIKTDS